MPVNFRLIPICTLCLIISACQATDLIPPTAVVSPPVAVEAAEVAATLRSGEHTSIIAEQYWFRPPEDALADYRLTLEPSGMATLSAYLRDESNSVTDARGTWEQEGDQISLKIDTMLRQDLSEPGHVHIVLEEGEFPVIVDMGLEGDFADLSKASFTIGSGEEHPLVKSLSRYLHDLDFLDYDDPGTELYSEDVRQAVLAFQLSQGLDADGVVGVNTWLLLRDPKQPPSSLTPVPPLDQFSRIPSMNDLPTHTEEGSPIVYLTFDDGPHPRNTPRLLDLLDQHDAKVTFFNLGIHVRRWPDVTREVVRRGHAVANHSWAHGSLKGVNRKRFTREVGRTQEAIIEAAGEAMLGDQTPGLLRPPYGATGKRTRTFAAEMGMEVVLWDIDPQDWRRPGAKRIARHVIKHVYPGAIVLSHDGGGDRSQTIAAYRRILPALQEKGYVFRTLYSR